MKCSFCNEDFNCKPSRVKRSKNIFCSTNCHDLFRKRNTYTRLSEKVGKDLKEWLQDKYLKETLSTREISTLLYGKGTLKPHVSQLLKEHGIPLRQGSEAIRSQWIDNDERRKQSREIANVYLNSKKSRNKLKMTMQTTEYKLNASIAKQGIKNPMYGVTGENHPNWNPDYDSKRNIILRKDWETVNWKKAVFERDSYSCVKCGDNKGGNLIAHHKNGWHWDIENRYNINNGSTLCKTCHDYFHSTYGYRNNTEKQFIEFLTLNL